MSSAVRKVNGLREFETPGHVRIRYLQPDGTAGPVISIIPDIPFKPAFTKRHSYGKNPLRNRP